MDFDDCIHKANLLFSPVSEDWYLNMASWWSSGLMASFFPSFIFLSTLLCQSCGVYFCQETQNVCFFSPLLVMLAIADE